MTKVQKFLLSVILAFGVVFSCFVAMSVTETIAYADNTTYYTAEQYTNSDYLLLDNGEESLTKTIKDFSDEVKSASIGTSFPELTQAIPSQILENSQETVSQYYGKEYGYYVVKEGDYVDVLLLDFEYEFDDGEDSDGLPEKDAADHG